MISLKTLKVFCLTASIISCSSAHAAESKATFKDLCLSWVTNHPVYTALAALAGITYVAYKTQPGAPTKLTVDNEEIDVRDAGLNLSHRGPLRLAIRRLQVSTLDICLRPLTHEAVLEGTQRRVFAFGYDSEYDQVTRQDIVNNDRIILEEHPNFKPWPSRWSPDAFAHNVNHQALANILRSKIQESRIEE